MRPLAPIIIVCLASAPLGACRSTEGETTLPDAALGFDAGDVAVRIDTAARIDAVGATDGSVDVLVRPPDAKADLGVDARDAALADVARDAAPDAPPPPAGAFAFGDGKPCAHELSNPNCWAGFGTSGLHPSGSFLGGGFDGRYLYLAGGGKAQVNPVTRYDTRADFGAPSSWEAFNVSSVNPSTAGFAGAAFDGRHVYFAPCAPPSGGTVLSRYDTQSPFGAPTSWSSFDLAAPASGSVNHARQYDMGAVFDGRYIYVVPNGTYGYLRGSVARYDTRAPLIDASSWSTFDTLSLDENAGGFRGAAFDGRYIYFVPWGDIGSGALAALPTGAYPVITRYDTTASFSAPASWSTFNPMKVGPTVAFIGAAFDGRYVYFAPADVRGFATRYDTRANFSSPSAWSIADMKGAGADWSYQGVRFDGRYVYFIPAGRVLVRYDTTADFASGASWSGFDLTKLEPRAREYHGGVFDGRFLYLVPMTSNLVLRFDARADGPLPPHNGASSF